MSWRALYSDKKFISSERQAVILSVRKLIIKMNLFAIRLAFGDQSEWVIAMFNFDDR